MQDGIWPLGLFRRVELGQDLIGNGVDIYEPTPGKRKLLTGDGDETFAIPIDLDAYAVFNRKFAMDFLAATRAEDSDAFMTRCDLGIAAAAFNQPLRPLVKAARF